jgi:hypothetical protein
MPEPRSTRRHLIASCVAAIVLWLSCHCPSPAAIVVEGSNAAKAANLNAWCGQYIAPVFHPTTDVIVRVLSDHDMNAYLNGDDPRDNSNDRAGGDDSNDDIDGVFENDPPRITLRLPDDGGLDMFTFAHEYGHFVWFDLLSGTDRKRYEDVYNHQRAGHHLVTRYAATNVEEGFAEAFSFFVNEAPMLRHRDSLSYQFLSDWSARAAHSLPIGAGG